MGAGFSQSTVEMWGLKASKMAVWQKQSGGDALERKVMVITIKGSM